MKIDPEKIQTLSNADFDREIMQHFRDGILLQMLWPSPFLEHSPEVLADYRRLTQDHWKRSIKLKRKYQQPIRPLPLP